LNYTRVTQFEKAWDEITLACRGLVVDKEGKVVARPLPKFFNDFEYPEGTIPYGLPFEAFIKYDGSLGIGFLYEGEVIIASRGSFASEQAVKAMEIFNREDAKHFIKPGYTFAFEIIYPSNRIVVDYGADEKLVLLAMYNTETGEEVLYEDMKNYFNEYFYDNNNYIFLGEKVTFDCDLKEYRSTIQGADEGYIIRFENGFRMKIKGEEYCRLHRILTHVSNKSIWQSLKDEKPLDEILDRIPDEFDAWVEKTIAELTTKFEAIRVRHAELFNTLNHIEDKKEFALAVIKNTPKDMHTGIIFGMRNGTTKWKTVIWDMIYPKFEKAAKTMHELKQDT
jgi:T4 RnlA family RNA ligase